MKPFMVCAYIVPAEKGADSRFVVEPKWVFAKTEKAALASIKDAPALKAKRQITGKVKCSVLVGVGDA